MGSKDLFQRFQNRILRKSRIFEYIFGADFTRNMASGHVVGSKNRENLKMRCFHQNWSLNSPEHDSTILKMFPECLGVENRFLKRL